VNEQWIDELRRGPGDVDPRPGFKDELRAQLIAERNGTNGLDTAQAGGYRRWWVLGAASACVALLVGGLVVLTGNEQALTPSTVPEPTPPTTLNAGPSTTVEPASTTLPASSLPPTSVAADLVMSDPTAISLDEWIDPSAQRPISAAVVEIDPQALPSGWVVSGQAGEVLVFPNAVLGYSYTAVVTTDDEAVFDVTFSRNPEPYESDPCFLPVAGYPGTVGDLTGTTPGDAVCGLRPDGSALAVVPATSGDGEGQRSALNVANALSFVEAGDVPHPDLTVAEGDEPVDVGFAGTLSGVRWAVTVEPSGTRAIFLYVAGTRSTGMEASAGTLGSGPVPYANSTFDGVPGYGAIIYGHVDGDAVAVVVTTTDQRTARLPMLLSEGRSAFAVPVPDTVEVATLTFVDAADGVVATADVPDIPVGFGAGALMLTPAR
jgi:hypothetical protein